MSGCRNIYRSRESILYVMVISDFYAGRENGQHHELFMREEDHHEPRTLWINFGVPLESAKEDICSNR